MNTEDGRQYDHVLGLNKDLKMQLHTRSTAGVSLEDAVWAKIGFTVIEHC